LRAKKKVQQTKRLLQEVGIEPERVAMFNIGASDAVMFAGAADNMAEIAARLGPNPLKSPRGEMR
jgi:F420-non-reducing hydrogenase iron-sulfur subunit